MSITLITLQKGFEKKIPMRKVFSTFVPTLVEVKNIDSLVLGTWSRQFAETLLFAFLKN